ncbi:MAG: UDP-N-acetylglucosamine 2-epimerase, partial [Planctomycetes bacterium]|nr:UDP-N-acetylglucosamine 2-epimerase [Planctomycetota bacterium]
MTASGKTRRHIGVFTSGRQDNGFLIPVARQIQAHPGLDLTVFLSGTHLLESFGRTDREFREAGLRCLDVPMFLDGVTSADINQIRPEDLAMLADRLTVAMRAQPVSVMVVLGDRIETLAAAVMVVADQRFLAHIHGGDRAAGEYDDGNRHAITKLSHVHFVASAQSAERVARMGEAADRIHQVGSPSIDNIAPLPTEAEARAVAGLPANRPYVVLLQHPSGLGDAGEALAATEICQAIVDGGLTAVCIEPNFDPCRKAIL